MGINQLECERSRVKAKCSKQLPGDLDLPACALSATFVPAAWRFAGKNKDTFSALLKLGEE